MKTKKLNLNELKVNSFVTSLEGKDAQTIKGGIGPVTAVAVAVTEVLVLVVALATVGVAFEAIEDNSKKNECKK